MKIPKAFENALVGRNDTAWLDHEPTGRNIEAVMRQVRKDGAALYAKTIRSNAGRVIQLTHMYRSPTHPDIVLTVITTATGKGTGQQLCEKDEPALAKLVDGYQRLMTRNQAMELALERGESAAFGFMVHPALLLRPQAAEDIYKSIMSRDSRVEVDGQRIVRLYWKGKDYILQTSKSTPAVMRLAGRLPEAARAGLMAKQHVPLSALVEHDYPRRINIKSMREMTDTNFKGGHAIELQFETDFVRLAPIPPEYDGDWSKPLPGKRY